MQRTVERLLCVVTRSSCEPELPRNIIDIADIADPVTVRILVKIVTIGIGLTGNSGLVEEVELVVAEIGIVLRDLIAGPADPDRWRIVEIAAPINLCNARGFLVTEIEQDTEIANTCVAPLLDHQQIGILIAEPADIGKFLRCIEIDDQVFASTQGSASFQVDRAAERTLDGVGGLGLEDLHTGEKLGRQILEVYTAIGGGTRDRFAIDLDIVVGESADLDRLPLAVIAAGNLHPGNTLQCFGDVLVRQLPDIFCGDGILDCIGTTLLVDRAFDAFADAADDDDRRVTLSFSSYRGVT